MAVIQNTSDNLIIASATPYAELNCGRPIIDPVNCHPVVMVNIDILPYPPMDFASRPSRDSIDFDSQTFVYAILLSKQGVLETKDDTAYGCLLCK